jgi:hypothetical protein
MVYFREHSDKVIDIWKENYLLFEPEVQLLYLYVASDVICKSASKGKHEYVKGFGDILIDCVKDIAR